MYGIYLLLLASVVAVCLFSVHSILKNYEDFQPEKYVATAVEELAGEAGLSLEELDFVPLEESTEDALRYSVRVDDSELAQVTLLAKGLPQTKLVVFTYREWYVAEVIPVLAMAEYEVTVPSDIQVKADGAFLETADAIPVSDREVKYIVRSYREPKIELQDAYGNEVVYVPGSVPPVTSMIVRMEKEYTVLVDGKQVPNEAVQIEENPEYTRFKEYVTNIPGLYTYYISVLSQNAKVTVLDAEGKEVTLQETGKTGVYEVPTPALAEVPKEVVAQIDVLEVAKNWSLFLSQDYSFKALEKHMIAGSYQHQVAKEYATGVDITFTSEHSLGNPPFTEMMVNNFTWITPDCFSVEIHFVKHMVLTWGKKIEDPMNDVFYFVRYDDSEDGVSNPMWKMVAMKEIVDDGR